MAGWSPTTPAETPAEPTAPNGAVAAPPPQAPVERVAELLESLFVLERDLTGELPDRLRACSVAELVKLFGSPAPAGDTPQLGAAT
jgi:hypothetical protein